MPEEPGAFRSLSGPFSPRSKKQTTAMWGPRASVEKNYGVGVGGGVGVNVE